MNKATRLLRELIALPSVNPAFLPRSDVRAGEHRVADYLAAVAASSGLDVELQRVVGRRSNLAARYTPQGPIRHRVLLAPHLDTVGGEDPDIYRPRVRQGRLYGRGSCDTKGCAAAMLTALLDVVRSGKRPASTEVVFLGLVDEENAQLGSRAAAKSWKADLAIVGEPTELKVVTAHKGDLWIEIQTRGRAAHGAQPHLGRNAVLTMARVVEALETEYADQLRRMRHPLLGTGTVNVGTIRGGTQPNIVPDECTISIDRRTLPGETQSGVLRELKTFLSECKLKAALGMQRKEFCPPLETRTDLPFVRALLATAGQRRPAGVHYFCDAAILAQGGIPSVVFGPGNIAQAHTTNEWISLNQLDQATRLLTTFLRSLP